MPDDQPADGFNMSTAAPDAGVGSGSTTGGSAPAPAPSTGGSGTGGSSPAPLPRAGEPGGGSASTDVPSNDFFRDMSGGEIGAWVGGGMVVLFALALLGWLMCRIRTKRAESSTWKDDYGDVEVAAGATASAATARSARAARANGASDAAAPAPPPPVRTGPRRQQGTLDGNAAAARGAPAAASPSPLIPMMSKPSDGILVSRAVMPPAPGAFAQAPPPVAASPQSLAAAALGASRAGRSADMTTSMAPPNRSRQPKPKEEAKEMRYVELCDVLGD